MTEGIIVALITGGLTLVGVIITSLATGRKTEESFRTAQAVTEAKLEDFHKPEK